MIADAYVQLLVWKIPGTENVYIYIGYMFDNWKKMRLIIVFLRELALRKMQATTSLY